MKKKSKVIIGAIIAILFIVFFTVIACGNQSPQEIASKGLSIDLSSGIEISHEDSHGGFHGDGHTFIVLQFSDNSILDTIKKDVKWKEFPLDETTQALVYGLEDNESHTLPFLSNEDGTALIPEIQNGYYILIDRQPETDTDILERYSFNFTIGIYDSDTNIMYFCELDT